MTDKQPDFPTSFIGLPPNITWAESGIIIKQIASIVLLLAGVFGVVVTPDMQAHIIAIMTGLFVIGCSVWTIWDRIKKHAPPIVPKADLAPRDVIPPTGK